MGDSISFISRDLHYLIQRAAYLDMIPLGTTELNKLLAELGIGIMSWVIVHTWELLAKEALFAALAAEGASARLVFRGKGRWV